MVPLQDGNLCQLYTFRPISVTLTPFCGSVNEIWKKGFFSRFECELFSVCSACFMTAMTVVSFSTFCAVENTEHLGALGVCSYDANINVDEWFDVHAQSRLKCLCVFLQVYTIDTYYRNLTVVGYATLNVFVETGTEKAPSVDKQGLQVSTKTRFFTLFWYGATFWSKSFFFFQSLFRYYSCLYCSCLKHLHILLTAGLDTVCLRLQLFLFVLRNKPIYTLTFVGVHALFF